MLAWDKIAGGLMLAWGIDKMFEQLTQCHKYYYYNL